MILFHAGTYIRIISLMKQQLQNKSTNNIFFDTLNSYLQNCKNKNFLFFEITLNSTPSLYPALLSIAHISVKLLNQIICVRLYEMFSGHKHFNIFLF